MPCKVVLTFESVDKILKWDHSNKKIMSCIFSVVLFIILCMVVLSFESVKEVLKCNH